jgi:hypothetical protein
MIDISRAELRQVLDAVAVTIERHGLLGAASVRRAARLLEEDGKEIERLRAGKEWPDGFAPTDECSVELAVSLSYMRDRAEKAEAELARIIAAYDAYRSRGVLPAPDEYAVLVKAINAARKVSACTTEGKDQ